MGEVRYLLKNYGLERVLTECLQIVVEERAKNDEDYLLKLDKNLRHLLSEYQKRNDE